MRPITILPLSLRLVLAIFCVWMVIAATACGSSAPTRGPATAAPGQTVVQPTTAPAPATQPPAPTAVQPTIAPLPTTGGLATLPVSPTVPSATVTLTRAPATKAPPAATTASQSPAPGPGPSGLTGHIVYGLVSDPAPRLHGIWSVKADGTGTTKLLDYGAWPAMSPSGKNIAFYMLPGSGKNEGLYVGDAFGGNAVPAYINPGVCCINWSRDGNWIVFAVSNKPNQPGGPIMMVKADGTYKTVVDLKVIGNGPAFSADSKNIVFSGCLPSTNTCGLLVAPADGTGTIRVVTRDNGGNAQWSPRGDKIVYQATDETNHNQVFAVNTDGAGKKQLTTGKGNDGQPVWSRDGNTIFWRSDQNGTSWAIYAMNADGSNHRKVLGDVPPDPNLWGWESLSVGP